VLQTKGQETRSHILLESRRLFTLQGFQNTSISTIIAATGVKKGNLYYHFPSKEELGLAVLLDARDEFFTILEHSFVGDRMVPRILHSCNAIKGLIQQGDFVAGCLFGNTALEMTDANSRFGQIIREVFSHWIELIEQELQLEADLTAVDPPLSTESLAIAIVALLEGGIMLARVYQDGKNLEVCITAIHGLLIPLS